jgi:hypothetical protein
VSLAEDDDMIKAFPSDRADQPFSMSILPWRSRRGWSVTNAYDAKPPFEKRAVDAVAVVDDILRRGSQPQASASCRAIHSAVGWAVTPSHMIWRRPCRRINKAYSSRNEIVGTITRSIDAIPSAWLRRNVFQPWDGGPLRRVMYLATGVWPTSMPSLRSSPWILGAPQSGLARLISRISWRISSATLGMPARYRDFHRQNKRKPSRCHRMTVSGSTIAKAFTTRGANR